MHIGADVAPASVLKALAFVSFDGGSAIDAKTEHQVSVVEVLPPFSAEMDVADSVVLGERLRFQTTVTNTAGRTLENVTLAFRVPKGLQFHNRNDVNPDSASCAGNATCVVGEESVVTLGTLTQGQSLIVDVNANTLLSGATGILPGSLIPLTQVITATGVTEPVIVQRTVLTERRLRA